MRVAFRAGRCSGIRRRLEVVAAALLLAGACSRTPEVPAGTVRGGNEAAPSPGSTPTTPAAEHLARGEEARERSDFPRAREELEKARALFEQDRNWEGYLRARNALGAVASHQGNYNAALAHLNAALATAQEKLSPGHAEVARSYYEIGTVQVSTGRPKEGLESLGKALALRRAGKKAPTSEVKYRFETARPLDIRERALAEGSVLVEYFLGKERLYIFTMAGRNLEAVSVVREPSLEPAVEELRRAISVQDFDAYARSAHLLHEALLAPIEGRLKGNDLVIIPDGPLNAVPFDALLERPVNARPEDARQLPYVLRNHAVSYAYFATVLLQGLRRGKESPPDEFVGFAPGFDAGTGPAQQPRPLPASRKEVTELRGLFAKRAGLFGGWFSGRSRVYLGRDATEHRLKSAGLERYRYVHLATHGIVDEEHPRLSRLLLAPDAGSGDDGVLSLGDVYNLRLNADLVVLSACDTGRGRIVRGEGIIGLARGFLYAGARSLLVSLWPVSDEAAAGLVVDFYAGLLEGQPKARALQQAKLRTMARNPQYAKPFYWSSLVLVGDGR